MPTIDLVWGITITFNNITDRFYRRLGKSAITWVQLKGSTESTYICFKLDCRFVHYLTDDLLIFSM